MRIRESKTDAVWERSPVKVGTRGLEGFYRKGYLPPPSSFLPKETHNYPEIPYEESRDWMSDTVTPGYFRSKRKGNLLPVNPMSKLSQTWDNVNSVVHTVNVLKTVLVGEYPTEWHIARVEHKVDYRGSLPSAARTVPSAEPYGFERNRMVQSALAKARGELWDVGTFMAEFNKTATMIAKAHSSTVTRMDNIIRHMLGLHNSHSRARSLKGLTDQFAALWMEGRFGWRLLYYDIMDAQEAYLRFTEGPLSLRKRYTVTEDEDGGSESAWRSTFPELGPATPLQHRWAYNTASVGRGGVGCSLDLSVPVSVDPLVTVKEVIPFSMVAEWFFTIGDAIEAWSPFGAGKLDYAFFGQRDFQFSQLEVRSDPDYNPFNSSYNNLPVLESVMEITTQGMMGTMYLEERKSRVHFYPTFEPLNFNPDIKGLRVFDALALGWLLRRKLTKLLAITKL